MPPEFDTDSEAIGSKGHYEAELTDRWSIAGRPNGGYVQAVMVGAIGQEANQPDLLSSTGHFLAPTEPGPATIEVEVLKHGRSLSNSRANLIQDGQVKVTVLAIHGNLEREGPTAVFDRPPPLSHLTSSIKRLVEVPIAERFDFEVSPAIARAIAGDADRDLAVPELIGRFRFRDRVIPPLTSLPLLVDAWPPTMFVLGHFGWAPTLELTVHSRGRPTSEWITTRLRSRYLIDGMVEEDCELWDESGRLVALSRQLALVMA
jgi:hypothetical protein